MTRSATQLQDALARGKFDEARGLLEQQLALGELFDPRTDGLWAHLADQIAEAIATAGGRRGVLAFWEQLRDFFLEVIEPEWGHAHKGHIYFRLGFSVAREDFQRALREFTLAYHEDVALERSRGGSPSEVAARSYRYSAYVALVIFERIATFDMEPAAREGFVRQLVGVSFNAAIAGQSVVPHDVHQALSMIVPAPALEIARALYGELTEVGSREAPFAIVAATEALLESVLLGKLLYGVSTQPSDRRLAKATLGPLFEEAVKRKVVPVAPIQAACQLVCLFRNRVHPGNEMRQEHQLTARVANTLKVLLELALVEWAQYASPTQR